MKLSDKRSIVAIDPTPRGIAFVFFENGEPLDWGERLCESSEDALRIADALIGGCAADVFLLEDADAPGSKRRPRIRNLLRAVAEHARRRGVSVVPISRADARNAWAGRGATNKAAVAAEIASRFGELVTIVPPHRGAGASEDPRMHIFDAASLTLYYDDTRRKRLAR